jgi:UDP-glucose 4-epimerase
LGEVFIFESLISVADLEASDIGVSANVFIAIKFGRPVKTIIFGGAGFVGTNLAKALLEAGESELLIFDNLSMGNKLAAAGLVVETVAEDMTDFASVLKVLKSFRPERVFHLAANSDISASAINPSLDVENTLLTSVNLAAAIRQSPVRELVFSSSSAIFGESSVALSEESPKRPVSAYGWMKLASEVILQSLALDNIVSKYLCVRFPNVTGAFQTHGVVHDLVRKLRLSPDYLEVLGDGSQLKPYALVSDLVLDIIRLIESDFSGPLSVNIGPDDQTTVSQIVNELVRESGLRPKVSFGESRAGWKGDVPEYMFDYSTAEKILGKLSFRKSLDAIRESVRWELGA